MKSQAAYQIADLPIVLTFDQVAAALQLTGTPDTRRRNVAALVEAGKLALVDADAPRSQRRITRRSFLTYIGEPATDVTTVEPVGAPSLRAVQ